LTTAGISIACTRERVTFLKGTICLANRKQVYIGVDIEN
jgi:hypothetical protein